MVCEIRMLAASNANGSSDDDLLLHRVLKSLPEPPRPAALREFAADVVAASVRGCRVSVTYSAFARPGASLDHTWNAVRARRI